ncbi:MAG: hypothetical protein M3037_07530 [Gemmatimonadota bacterium]|nr:hypothetical protein [Gemmatimonadota bacterium]MDQ6871852.1 hypothetical protein [Gemmatimonadota bacterium]
MSPGFGVDTAIADVRDVFSLVRAYLAKPDSSARARGLWSTATNFDRTLGDITAWQVNQGFPATVIGVIPAIPGDSVYIVRILYAQADSTGKVSPLALQRLYAVREGGAPYSFRLAAAFPRVRTEWEQRSKGPLTFWYVPGQRPNPARIDDAGCFVDSVSALFSVPVPRHLDVIVGRSMDDVQRAIGLDFFPEASGPGQRSGGLNLGFIILSGNPAIGEAYFHELVHSILGPSLPAGSKLLSEGVATWLGGSRGRSPREMYALLRRYQVSDSTLTLSRLIRSDFQDPDADRSTNLLYASGALISDSIYRKGGIAALRGVYRLKGDPESLIRAISVALGFSSADNRSLDNWWRAEAQRAARDN